MEGKIGRGEKGRGEGEGGPRESPVAREISWDVALGEGGGVGHTRRKGGGGGRDKGKLRRGGGRSGVVSRGKLGDGKVHVRECTTGENQE